MNNEKKKFARFTSQILINSTILKTSETTLLNSLASLSSCRRANLVLYQAVWSQTRITKLTWVNWSSKNTSVYAVEHFFFCKRRLFQYSRWRDWCAFKRRR